MPRTSRAARSGRAPMRTSTSSATPGADVNLLGSVGTKRRPEMLGKPGSSPRSRTFTLRMVLGLTGRWTSSAILALFRFSLSLLAMGRMPALFLSPRSSLQRQREQRPSRQPGRALQLNRGDKHVPPTSRTPDAIHASILESTSALNAPNDCCDTQC